ncbi:Ig-like domain-containing protein [Pseudescherichia vulneris]|uniref:Ig-like domain-containing protein n=1 Tax=Pseudescherichia vulneris TaxID=566 RepID=UPI00098B07DD|nr:Ig-like domain-containing protein [Pseudescherichia vulneris]STQ59132.1 Ig family protein [Pseudescherichia vulneris]
MKVKSKPKPLTRERKTHLFERIRRSNWQQTFVLFFICIFSLTTYPVSASFLLSPPTTSSTETQADSTTLPGSDTLSTTASALSSSGADGMKGVAASAATGYAASSAQDWLSQFGTAKVKLNVDDNGNWDDSSLDFLLPLYENQQQLLFTQLGYRAPDGRNTGNFGLGVRVFNLEHWMFGGNVFFDDDFTGKNRRFGAGAEAWTDFLKLGFNTYAGTTDWHTSRDYADYDEKPADGFDVRVDGYLPAYPQLGGKLMYEKYYGDDVALFDKDTLQNDPSAVTVGLNYTPIPLVTAGVDYRRGQDSVDETEFSLNFRYALGQPWGAQISSDQVAVRRSLAGSRYDLVDRNNEIVLQYKKKQNNDALADMTLTSIQDNSPADGATNNTVMVHAVTSDGSAARNAAILWSVSGTGKLSATSGVTDGNGNATVAITDTTAEQVTVSATSGSITRSTPSSFNESVSSLNLKLTDNNSKADGSDADSGQVTVRDASGKVMSGVQVSWSVDHSATIVHSDTVTDGEGHATVDFTDTKAETVKLTASASGKTESTDSAFVAAATANTVSVTMTTDNAQADGVTANVARATVKDSTGKALSGVTVNWATTGSAKLSAGSSVTDANGNATVNLTDTVAESGLTVTATAGDASGTTTTTFVGIQQNIAVVMTTDNSPADGTTPNVARATVTDSSGKPLSNVTVNWATTGSAKLAAASSVTDGSGVATVNLTDTVAESGVTVTATTDNAKGSTTTTFKGIQQNIIVAMTTDSSPADGVTPNVAHATVTDSNGKALANVTVNWTTTGSAKLAAASSVTDGSGVATVNLTDTVAESGLTVTAMTENAKGSTTTTFVEIQKTIAVEMTTDNSLADGVTPNVASATVTDSSGKPLANVTVNWATTGNAKLAAASSVTDTNGIATVNLTDTVAESGLTVTAAAGSAKGSTTTTFKSALDTLTVTTTTDNSPADGMSTNVVNAMVKDANGKALSGVTVNWSVTGSAVLKAPTSVTDSSGNATMSLTDKVVESNLTVTAAVGDVKGTTLTTFSQLQQDVTVTMKVNNSAADGKTQNIAQVVVLKDNRPVSGAEVSWTKDSNNAKNASAPTAYTDSNGIATMIYTDTVAETFNVVATVGDETGKTQSTFVAPEFGPIAISLPEAPNLKVNMVIATDGTPVLVKHYNGMMAGDEIAVSSHVTEDKNGQTLPYSAPVHTVAADEVGQDISIMLPESALMNVEGPEDGSVDAHLHVDAVVTQGDQKKSASLTAGIDTCLPGDTVCK